MYLVSDEKHTPTACFTEYDDALGLICSWHHLSPRLAELGMISHSLQAVYNTEKHIVGYIRYGVEINPSFIKR